MRVELFVSFCVTKTKKTSSPVSIFSFLKMKFFFAFIQRKTRDRERHNLFEVEPQQQLEHPARRGHHPVGDPLVDRRRQEK